MVVSSEGVLVRPALENVKLANYKDTAFLAWEDRVHCLVVISNASLRPSKLKNHQDKKDAQRKDDDVDALSAKTARYDLEATLPHFGFTLEEKPTLQRSYEVASN